MMWKVVVGVIVMAVSHGSQHKPPLNQAPLCIFLSNTVTSYQSHTVPLYLLQNNLALVLIPKVSRKFLAARKSLRAQSNWVNSALDSSFSVFKLEAAREVPMAAGRRTLVAWTGIIRTPRLAGSKVIVERSKRTFVIDGRTFAGPFSHRDDQR